MEISELYYINNVFISQTYFMYPVSNLESFVHIYIKYSTFK